MSININTTELQKHLAIVKDSALALGNSLGSAAQKAAQSMHKFGNAMYVVSEKMRIEAAQKKDPRNQGGGV